ncbi:MAG: ARPP-1 family domain-containing protein [Bacteroidales bacterium]
MNLQTIVGALHLGPPVGAANLTMFPLLAREESPAGYATLDEALAAGTVRVTEVSETGCVPELTIVNDGAIPVLVLDGEELVGAKQNRIVNLTILVPAHSRLPLPVSCVEAGRWQHRSRAFAAAGRTHYAHARAMKVAHVSASMRESGNRVADQSAIWQDIAAKSRRMAAPSPTSAAAAMYEKSRGELDAFQSKLHAQPLQVGAIFAIHNSIVGMELFDAASTWRKSMRKVVESYGLDALDPKDEPNAPVHDDPQQFLEAIGKVGVEKFPALGMGEDLRLRAPRVSGAALALEGRVLHLLAFAA